MLKKHLLYLLVLLVNLTGLSQGNFNLPNKKSDKIKFELINNLIVLPVEVNGVELSFILDSGVSKPILFNIINLTDSLQINDVEIINLRGLGADGVIEALKSKHNFIKIGNAININQDIYVVFDNTINFTPRLGKNIHGIIGYDLFKDFIVEINYSSKVLKLNRPNSYKYKRCKKCETFNLTFYNFKPFIDAAVTIDSLHLPVKLLVDTGSSDALWLFEDEKLKIRPDQNKYFEDFLGKGLSGHIYGKRSKLSLFKLSKFQLEDINVAFPDSASISFARKFVERNGSISGELLKRFNLIVDYKNAKITLKKNGNFNKPFLYDKSGLVLEQDGVRMVKEKENTTYLDDENSMRVTTKIMLSTIYKYSFKPAFKIVEIRKDSPAERSGLLEGDIILSVNAKGTQHMKLQELTQLFCDKDDKLIKLIIDRAGNQRAFAFRLESFLK